MESYMRYAFGQGERRMSRGLEVGVLRLVSEMDLCRNLKPLGCNELKHFLTQCSTDRCFARITCGRLEMARFQRLIARLVVCTCGSRLPLESESVYILHFVIFCNDVQLLFHSHEPSCSAHLSELYHNLLNHQSLYPWLSVHSGLDLLFGLGPLLFTLFDSGRLM